MGFGMDTEISPFGPLVLDHDGWDVSEARWRQKYDSEEGLAAILKKNGLSGLNEIASQRRLVGYSDCKKRTFTRLNEFIFLGRWWSDSCGNMMKITRDFIPKDHYPTCPMS